MPQDEPILEPLGQSDRDKLDELERQVARIQAQFADMQLSWAETLDKLQAWAQRQATRDRRALATKLEPEQEAAEELAPAPVEQRSAAPTKAELRQRLAALQRKAM